MATKKSPDRYTFGTYEGDGPALNLASQTFDTEQDAVEAAVEDFDDEMWEGFTTFKITPVGDYELVIKAQKTKP